MVGRYVLGEVLGAGGMGVVHRAFDVRLGREVAIKVVDLSAASEADRVRFEREALAVGRLHSPHVVTVHDVGEDVTGGSRVGFLVMELLEGVSLQAALAGGLPTVEDVIAWGRQMCRGLRDAHAAGVVHRDIKPSNMMLSPHGTVTLLDFGIARMYAADETLTRPGTVVGTPAYMAPERLRGEGSNTSCDLYSLGCVLYELLTGQPPFGRGVHRPNLTWPLPVLTVRTDVPVALEALVLELLCLDPDGRPDAVEAERRLAAALQPVPQGASVTGTAVWEAVTRTAPRRVSDAAPPATSRPAAAAPGPASSTVAPPRLADPACDDGGGWSALVGAAGFGGQLSLFTGMPGWAAAALAAVVGATLWVLCGPPAKEEAASGGTVLMALAADGVLSLYLAFWSRAPWWIALTVLVVAGPALLGGCTLVDRLVSRLIVSQRAQAKAGATAGMANAAVLVVLTGQLPVTATVTMGVGVWLLIALVAAIPGLLPQPEYVGRRAGRSRSGCL
ncbi:protein kinase [Streptomyces sp. NPDC007355]|uniref:serine/threonine-protein kinase n=1 Tax=Streptomyces sp. NPDC007355 TaxID=3364778 RepID=UPI0036B5C3C4